MKFTKMHGCGNDYIFVDSRFEKIENPEKLARVLSDRHMGVGADGLVLIGTSDKADVSMRMYNADGSVGEMCGNAIRCIGKYVFENNIKNKTTLTVDTLAGVKTLFLTLNQNKVVEVMVDLGKPIILAKEIPVISERETVVEEPITVLDRNFTMTCVSMGNPHAVIFVDNVASFPVATYGLPLEHSLRFPNRVNVEFVQVVDRNNIKIPWPVVLELLLRSLQEFYQVNWIPMWLFPVWEEFSKSFTTTRIISCIYPVLRLKYMMAKLRGILLSVGNETFYHCIQYRKCLWM